MLVYSKAAPRGERARIERLIAWAESAIRRAFRRFLDDVRSAAVRQQVRRALEQRNIGAALRVIDSHIARMGSALTEVFQRAGTSEAASLARRLRVGGAHIAISFDPTNPRAAELMRLNRLEFVRQMSLAQAESIRNALVDALRAGYGTTKTAAAFQDAIGLTEAQRLAVANYRRLLESSDLAALSRDLRDRRYDAAVRRAAAGEPLGAERIERMVAGYRNRYLRYRASTVARTETHRIVGQARVQATEQVLDDVGIPRDQVVRTWAATLDRRTRDSHAMMNGQQRGMDEPYESPYGSRFMFPGDGSLGADAAELVNCRCTEFIEIKRER